MVQFHVLTEMHEPRLHVWRDRTAGDPAELAYDAVETGRDEQGLLLYAVRLDHQIHEQAHALLHDARAWEPHEHTRTLPRTAEYRFPQDMWLVQGANRVLSANPFAANRERVRVHLITTRRYRDGQLYLWLPGQPGRFIDPAGTDELGPYFDVDLRGRECNLFLFKFRTRDGESWEPDFAHRLWVAADGPEVWVHCRAAGISRELPKKRVLTVRYLDYGASGAPVLHLWQEDSDYVIDVEGARQSSGWARFDAEIYSELRYDFMFYNAALSPAWEHEEARRNIVLKGDAELWTRSGNGSSRKLGTDGIWTLEGDHELFGSEPTTSSEVVLQVVAAAPNARLGEPTGVDVWINRARSMLAESVVPNAEGRFVLRTYPNVVTSFRFRFDAAAEPLDRHFVKVSKEESSIVRHIVLGRPDPLPLAPVTDLFQDPPFAIERPGAWKTNGVMRFALHCPSAASVELIGEWAGWEERPVPMRSTSDGTFWWAEIPLDDILRPLGVTSVHGVRYRYRLNQVKRVQDPAADWVENSSSESASRLVDHEQYVWRSSGWERPGWDYLIVYQLHPSRFSRRAETVGLDAVVRELTADDGYLRQVNATAILLMPTCEFAGDHGWGYNPSFFYTVESAYGGPDALKRLVDSCHERGIAVLLDVVFNHAGTSDNVLWSVARESYFDGDTEWGAMINFDHPQVVHFFQKNLVHFMQNYRIDGFRFDFTRVIRYGGTWSAHVRQPGSGGGWEFMHALRSAVHAVDSRCLFMAENLPNEWDLTRLGGPMDTQWCDDFHDKLVEASRGWSVLRELADAMEATHRHCHQWYEATNYPESHDEVGNEPNRIVHVAGPGQGYRRNKIAAATTLLGRGIPLFFMGAESGEWRQFSKDGDQALDLTSYENDEPARRLRSWWNRLCELRRGDSRIKGPSPIHVRYVDQSLLTFSRGDGADLFVIANFGPWSGWRSLADLNLPEASYKELLNSTWGDYRIGIEGEDEHGNGGWSAHLDRSHWLNVPDYGVVVLERR